jgi:iron complex transport system substrate-binding protein
MRVLMKRVRCVPGLRPAFILAGVGCALLSFVIAAPAGAATLPDAPGQRTAGDSRRIVSIGGAVTEVLYALGMDKSVVAVDTTSLYPSRALKEKPNVGYMRQLSAEGVLGLAPTLILATADSGPKETMAVLEAAKVPIVIVPDRYSGEGIVEKINVIARSIGADDRGRCLAGIVDADLAALHAIETAIGQRKRVMFVLSFMNGRVMVSGRNTAADGMIRLAGGENAVTDYDGYKPVSDEAVIAAKPDVVLVMERSGAHNLTADEVFAHPAFGATPAAQRRAFVSMEGLYLLGFGPRSARAARDLAATLYPDLSSRALPSERDAAIADSCRDR